MPATERPCRPPDIREAFQPLDDKQIRSIQKKLERQRQEAVHEERGILCRACGHVITAPRFRTTVNGRHVHTFVNPGGIEFTIGCFSDAPGCHNIGIPTLRHTWFPEYGWRIALCGDCQIHLGWQFLGENRVPFHGLILDHVVEP